MAKFSVSGIIPHGCVLVEPARYLIEEYGVVVGHTLVDASLGSGSVLIVNPNAEVVVLPGLTLIGKLVPVISVAIEGTGPPVDGPDALPGYLEEIVEGSHSSLGEPGRQFLRDLLLHYRHVFPAPGEPVTGRISTVQHDIITTDARPVHCGPRRLAPAGLRKEQTCVKEMLEGRQIEPSDSPWASPMVLVMKKDGSTCFCVDYRRLNALTMKDAYPLPRIDDSLRLLGNQQWLCSSDCAMLAWLLHAKKRYCTISATSVYSSRPRSVRSCRRRSFSWDILSAAWDWHVTPRNWRRYGTGTPRIKLKESDSSSALSDTIADLLRTSWNWRNPWWP